MFKSFAASLLSAAALARGTADGSSADNAYVTVLIDEAPIKLTLYTYNATTQSDTTRTEDVHEFHGDTHLQTTSAITSAVRYGWCIEAKPFVDEIPLVPAEDAVEAIAEVKNEAGEITTAAQEAKPAKAEIPAVPEVEAVWDCQVIQTDLDSTDVDLTVITEIVETDWYKTFNISDHSYKGKAEDWTFDKMTADVYSEAAEAETSWVLSGSKSYKECGPSDNIVKNDDAVLKAAFKSVEDDGKVTNKQATWVDCKPKEAQTGHSADAAASRFGANAHWFRNFKTTQPDTDMQLSLEDNAAAPKPVFGFFTQYGRAQAAESADRAAPNGKINWFWQPNSGGDDEDVFSPKIKSVTPISDEWKKVQVAALKKEVDDAAAAQAEEDAKKNNENNEEETDGDGDDDTPTTDDGKVEDGAAQIAAHTTAFIVAVSALAF